MCGNVSTEIYLSYPTFLNSLQKSENLIHLPLHRDSEKYCKGTYPLHLSRGNVQSRSQFFRNLSDVLAEMIEIGDVVERLQRVGSDVFYQKCDF